MIPQIALEDIIDLKRQLDLFNVYIISSVDPSYGPIRTSSQKLWTFSQELLKLASVSQSRRITLDCPVVVMDILDSVGIASSSTRRQPH